ARSSTSHSSQQRRRRLHSGYWGPAAKDPGRPEGATGPRPVGRVVRLFRPYGRPLSALLLLILVSAGLGIISPFLLREVLDKAIPEKDTALLTALVAGMVAIPIATGALGIGQTWLSNRVGQQV